jgi:hypothetical protein
MRYSTRTETTKKFCEQFGYNFDIGFVETAKLADGAVAVAFTLGHPDEVRHLKSHCDGVDYVWYKDVKKDPPRRRVALRAVRDFINGKIGSDSPAFIAAVNRDSHPDDYKDYLFGEREARQEQYSRESIWD